MPALAAPSDVAAPDITEAVAGLLLNDPPAPMSEPEQVEPISAPVADENPLTWPRSPQPFRPRMYADARARYVRMLIACAEQPHTDDEAVIDGYWRLLTGLESPAGVRVAEQLLCDPVRRTLLETGLLAKLGNDRIAALLNVTAEAAAAARLLYFDPQMPFRAAQLDVMQRFWAGDPLAVLPAVAQHGGWELVEQALGMRAWTTAGQRQMDELIDLCTQLLLQRLWLRNCSINERRGQQHRTVQACIRLQQIAQERTASAPDGNCQ